jgi:asparagine synthase (glutamine-hydrolysing)
VRDDGHGAELLDGSFALAVVRDAQALVVTDLVGSRKVFCTERRGEVRLSTDLAAVVPHGAAPDAAGVALHLANGAALNGRTPFAGVRALERASVHLVSARGIESRPYWRYGFAGEHSVRPRAELRRELAALLRAAVSARRQPGPAFLSLSAGLDSRAILAQLAREHGAGELLCFSYAHGAPKRGSDATLARELALRSGVRHELVESYAGDLQAVLDANARLGGGVANFCDEVDAWTALARRPRAAVWVGDECFGWVDAPLSSDEDVLEVVGIRGSEAVAWLAPLLPAEAWARLRDGLDAEIAEITARAATSSDPHDRKDFLYLDQRVTHVLMPWRERFAARLGRVQMPFLDRRILEFMRGVPSALRRDKLLYREALAEALPGVLAVPRARRSGYLVNWNRELAAHAGALRADVQSTESSLDELIPPEVVLGLLERRAGAPAAARYAVKKAVDFADSRRGLAGRVARAAGARPLRRIDESTVLLRLLVLRKALAL